MAEAITIGAVAGTAVSKSSDGIIHVIKKLWQFRSKLTQTEETTKKIKPYFTEIGKQNTSLNIPIEENEMYINHLKAAEELVQKCKNMKWYDSYKRYRYSSKLDDLDESLRRFIQIYGMLQMRMNANESLMISRELKAGKGIGSCSSSGVSLPKGDVIGFEDGFRDLKAMLLTDSEVDDDCSVLVVSAAGGCGKTTLVTDLCQDRDIEENFGRNIYFVTISETPNIKGVVKILLQNNQCGQQLDFVNDEEATRQWGSFLRGNTSKVLLVLDDVWDASIITKFIFKSPTYKILVTSRNIFEQFKTYELQPLNDRDATKLFRHYAFSSHERERIDISDALVDEMVNHCKNHPLILKVIGGLLKGKGVSSWDGMLKKLSEGTESVLDLDDSILLCLERSLDMLQKEPTVKQCFLDLGLFPEDQKIAATMLMDMWVHLYKHDEKGLETINHLTKLSSKNLATRSQIRKHLPTIANYCEEEYVVQHDTMRRLAIKLSSKEPLERLIIMADEQMPSQLPHTVNARILSISTGERFSMIWNDYQVREVEVFVLNFMSQELDLPQFMENMDKLKVLIITNYGYYFSQLQNFPTSQYLSGLTRIRLEHVLISSISTSLPKLENLQKLSLIMCKIGNSFNEGSMPNKFPSLLEIEMESCEDLVTFPAMFCNLVRLKSLSITNCLELSSLPDEFGKLTNLEILRLASCSKLTALPESMTELQKLSIIDLNYCLQLSVLPTQIGELGCLGTILMIGCTGLVELPSSVKDSCSWNVVCDEEIFQNLWSHLLNVKVKLVEEDRVQTFMKIVAPRK